MLYFDLHFLCPQCGHKLSSVSAMESATLNVRRTCPNCHRLFSLTVTPIKIKQGWAHSASFTEVLSRITEQKG
jgi:transcription elongation factor Elf1